MLNPFSRHSGFSLIELMIAVAVLGIIVAIAYPSYQNHVFKTRRSDAKVALMDTAQRLERCYTDKFAYNHDDCNGVIDATSPEGFYTIDDTTRTATAYTLTATATGAQAGDTACSTMTLDQAGARAPADCW